MKQLFLRLFDYLDNRRWLMWMGVALVAVVCVLSISRMTVDEEITAFLPFEEEEEHRMELYGQFAGGEKILAMFECQDADKERLMDAIDSFEVHYNEMGIKHKLNSRIDIYEYLGALEQLYQNMPYYLTDEDYVRMDSLLSTPEYVDSMMRVNWRNMLMPMPAYSEVAVKNDPLHLFDPVIKRLMMHIPYGNTFTVDDGYLLSKDGKKGIIWLDTPYGASESHMNGELIDSLETVCRQVNSGDVTVRLTGAPVVAVENARCIKHDSMAAGIVAMLIIIALLWVVLRNMWSMLLIVLTIGFGWLVALGTVSAVFCNVSIIVIGMGSVLSGIAVNYPLHVVMHRNYTTNVRENLSELVSPLVIGNITTVGAFFTLMPLEADAMRQLGLFAASLLVGTILFSVIVLPHILPLKRVESRLLLSFMPTISPKSSVAITIVIAVITIVLGLFIPTTSFDTNLSNINYLTEAQKRDLAMLSSMSAHQDTTHTLFVIQDEGNWNQKCLRAEKVREEIEAMEKEGFICNACLATDFMPSRKMQEKRIGKWEDFMERHRQQIDVELNIGERRCGFTDDAFAPFRTMRHTRYAVRDSSAFIPVVARFMPEKVKSGIICDRCQVSVEKEKEVTDRLQGFSNAFTFEQNNAAMAENLSGDFDFIGMVCSLIVFLFLWGSFRNLKLALLAFLPMVISWIWILGIMGISGIQFNIVNVILATFIFGQGDDYTIFMVEGVMHEHRTGQSMLPQYRTEILMSAVIMLVGIGTLVISHHPAMHSLGIVTHIGMSVVVVLAYLLPQALFNIFMTIKNKRQ